MPLQIHVYPARAPPATVGTSACSTLFELVCEPRFLKHDSANEDLADQRGGGLRPEVLSNPDVNAPSEHQGAGQHRIPHLLSLYLASGAWVGRSSELRRWRRRCLASGG